MAADGLPSPDREGKKRNFKHCGLPLKIRNVIMAAAKGVLDKTSRLEHLQTTTAWTHSLLQGQGKTI
jgi:hypothetical protein